MLIFNSDYNCTIEILKLSRSNNSIQQFNFKTRNHSLIHKD